MIVAFDECTIIHSFAIPVPDAWQGVIGKSLKHENYDKIKTLLDALKDKGKKPYRFMPSKINIVKQAQELIPKGTNIVHVLGKEITKSIKKFMDELNDWETIERKTDIDEIKKLFLENEKELKKDPNIPEDEDLEILAGYKYFETNNQKIIISEDEHFWGYHELIRNNLNMHAYPEWNAHITARHL